MSALIKSVKIFNKINKNPAAIYAIVRNAGHWNKDFAPGPLPKTEEERRAAAKKYGLLPEEYRTYPEDDEHNCGDYPHLEDKPIEQRDPFYPYDHPEHRRNYEETIHADIDFYDETRAGFPGPFRVPIWQMILILSGFMAANWGLYYWLEDKKYFRPAMPKQYPSEGKHYSFEPSR